MRHDCLEVLALDEPAAAALLGRESAGVDPDCIGAAAAVLYAGDELAALKAAGFTGRIPVGGKVIQGLISTLQSNWEWLIATGVVMVLVVVAGLMMFGSQRAPDHLFRVITRVLMILVVVPAILA